MLSQAQAPFPASDDALRRKLPGFFWSPLWFAIVHGQLGNRDEAAHALVELDAADPDFGSHARRELEKWFVETVPQRKRRRR